MTLRRTARALRDERGFTLVEMLITTVAGTVVLLVTLMVLNLSMTQSARITDRIETSQAGRIALEHLMQELHSSCVAASVAPVLAGSTGTTIKFLSQFGSAAVLTPNLHQVSITSGTLTDTVYAATGGSAPSWTFSATPTIANTFLTNVSQASVNGSAQPVFQYYEYVNGQLSTTALATPLSATDALAAAGVTISVAVGPSSTSTEANRTINLSDSAVLRFDPSTSAAAASNLPCQ